MKKTIAILIAAACIASCKQIKETADKYPTDNHLEELVESVVEKKMENILKLPDGALHGTVDFSFWETEDAMYNDCMRKCEAEADVD